MKRRVYTVLACAAFLAMLTGTKKVRPPREAGSIPKLTIPPTTGWARNEVAGIRFLSPPSSVVERAEQLAGIHVKFPSGAVMTFESTSIDLSTKAQHAFHMYFAPDASIELIESGGGDYCLAVVCSSVPIMGSPLCVSQNARKHEECTQMVALVRSIEPL